MGIADMYRADLSLIYSQIVISPFDYVNTNDLLSSAQAFNIDGVIIQYDQQIEAAGYYAKPQLISIIST